MLVVGTVSLYFLGAEPRQMFALAVFVGLLAATFASLRLSAPIWAWLWSRRLGFPPDGGARTKPRHIMFVSAHNPSAERDVHPARVGAAEIKIYDDLIERPGAAPISAAHREIAVALEEAGRKLRTVFQNAQP